MDADDGEKIVHNIFGPNTGEVVSTLGASAGQQQSLMAKLLPPLLAPIVLAYLSKRLSGGGQQGRSQDRGNGDMLTDLLGSVLGGGRASAQSAGGGSGSILDMLGSLLGAGRR